MLRKGTETDWDVRLPKGASCVNQRIIGYLGLSPSDLLFGPVQSVTPVSATLLALSNRDLRSWAESLTEPSTACGTDSYLSEAQSGPTGYRS